MGTIYRHFPTRADLIIAVYRHQVEACAEAGPALLASSADAVRRAGAVDRPLRRLPGHQARARRRAAVGQGRLRVAARLLPRPPGAGVRRAARRRGRGGRDPARTWTPTSSCAPSATSAPAPAATRATTPAGWSGCSSPGCASHADPDRTSHADPDRKGRERIAASRQYLCVDEKLRSWSDRGTGGLRGRVPRALRARVPVHRPARWHGPGRGPGGRGLCHRVPAAGLLRPWSRLGAVLALRDRGQRPARALARRSSELLELDARLAAARTTRSVRQRRRLSRGSRPR